jgi:tetratricopeptide (TPR) repeat protein
MTFAEEHVEHARRYAALSKDNDISTSRMWLIHGLLSLAQYQTAGQKPDLAMTTLEEVKQMLEQMTTEEAQFRSTREMQASWAFFTGEAANVQENWPVAAERYRVADQYYRDLLEDFSEDLSLRSHLAEIQMRLAVLSSRIGEYTAALEFANQAEGLVQEILNKVPNDWLANQLNLQIAQLRALIESTHPNDEVDKNGR